MRKLMVASAGAALMAAGGAGAQGTVQGGPGAGYPPPGAMGSRPTPPMRTAQHWGGDVGGRWSGGVNAPGGWAGYRQPYRGYRVPGYWVSPRFSIIDHDYYGLPRPISGYRWARYYDDAVMIDRGGSVADYRSGVDWDGRYDDRRSSGAGGAIAGAAVGGVAGNVVAGGGDRLAGTSTGAGVGGAAGHAIDRSRDRRGPPPRRYDDDYREGPPPPPYQGRDGNGYPPGSSRWVSPDGRMTVITTGGTYYGDYSIVSAPYGYGLGGSVTTVTVQSTPTVTTTTTETIEDRATYIRPAVRRVYDKRVYRTKRVRARRM